ncbi:hypothetical protein HPG69_000837 [Diceros bicornis minor]|uniref:KRAB domain-containing protein n=1 Tax=Diceros bicornis minor TaxID=77932 RepID=A0A7J7F1Y7_DICBM|nr:hypothetical protein HPG69_000837 [Diceros bicornis minor]
MAQRPAGLPSGAAPGSGHLSSQEAEPLTFQDVVVYFSRAMGRRRLGPDQRPLYTDVMLENYGHVASLGLPVPKPELIFQLEQGEELWVLDLLGAEEPEALSGCRTVELGCYIWLVPHVEQDAQCGVALLSSCHLDHRRWDLTSWAPLRAHGKTWSPVWAGGRRMGPKEGWCCAGDSVGAMVPLTERQRPQGGRVSEPRGHPFQSRGKR